MTTTANANAMSSAAPAFIPVPAGGRDKSLSLEAQEFVPSFSSGADFEAEQLAMMGAPPAYTRDRGESYDSMFSMESPSPSPGSFGDYGMAKMAQQQQHNLRQAARSGKLWAPERQFYVCGLTPEHTRSEIANAFAPAECTACWVKRTEPWSAVVFLSDHEDAVSVSNETCSVRRPDGLQITRFLDSPQLDQDWCQKTYGPKQRRGSVDKGTGSKKRVSVEAKAAEASGSPGLFKWQSLSKEGPVFIPGASPKE